MGIRSIISLAATAGATLTGSTDPTATILNGTVIGYTAGAVENFRGIPFAQPPTGNLRLRPPQPIAQSFGTIEVKNTPPACPQFVGEIDPKTFPDNFPRNITDYLATFSPTSESEDCLTLDIQRPAGTKAHAKLPVLFYIYGGGFEYGSKSTYNGSGIVETSISLGKNIIFVAANYRLGAFGFLPGKEVQRDGSTNLGLRDQRLALQWLQDNIASFGGDADKVTIWGESAGSISVVSQTIINNGDNTYNGRRLFRAAISDSGSYFPALNVTSKKAQGIYNAVVHNASCTDAPDTLACLRHLPYEEFRAASNSLPPFFSYRSLDLSYLPRPDPSDNFFPRFPVDSFRAGAVSRVPIIAGTQEDEGTIFALTLQNISSTTEVVEYLTSYFPEADPKLVKDLVDAYPSNPVFGSPYRTGTENEFYPQFKRLASILGDMFFTLAKRTYIEAVSSVLPATYSYIGTYTHGTPILGTYHVSDVIAAYKGEPTRAAASIREYYINFVHHLNPNHGSNLTTWPQWTWESPLLLNISLAENTLARDIYRTEAYELIRSNADQLKL